MRINKLLTILLLLIIAIPSHSQVFGDKRQRLKGEFIFGIDPTSLDFVGDNTYNKLRVGFHMGFLADYSITPNIFVQSGYILRKKGGQKKFNYSKSEDGVTTTRNTKFTIDANYMEIPLSIGTRYAISNSVGVAITVGGYFAYGFKGYVKQDGTVVINNAETNDSRNSLDVFKDNCFKRFDYGLTCSASIYFGSFYFFRVGFEQGLANVVENSFLKNTNYDLNKVTKIKTITTSFSLGFRF